MVKFFNSALEKSAWWIVVLVLIANIIVGIIAYNDGQEVKQLIQSSHTSNIQTQENIIKTQQTIITKLEMQDTDLRSSVKCLLSLNPPTATAQKAQACFNVVTGE